MKARIRYGMYNFQKLNETTSFRRNDSSENSVPKRYAVGVFFHVATGSFKLPLAALVGICVGLTIDGGIIMSLYSLRAGYD